MSWGWKGTEWRIALIMTLLELLRPDDGLEKNIPRELFVDASNHMKPQGRGKSTGSSHSQGVPAYRGATLPPQRPQPQLLAGAKDKMDTTLGGDDVRHLADGCAVG